MKGAFYRLDFGVVGRLNGNLAKRRAINVDLHLNDVGIYLVKG